MLFPKASCSSLKALSSFSDFPPTPSFLRHSSPKPFLPLFFPKVLYPSLIFPPKPWLISFTPSIFFYSSSNVLPQILFPSLILPPKPRLISFPPDLFLRGFWWRTRASSSRRSSHFLFFSDFGSKKIPHFFLSGLFLSYQFVSFPISGLFLDISGLSVDISGLYVDISGLSLSTYQICLFRHIRFVLQSEY